MKIVQKMNNDLSYISLQEIYCNTVLETAEGNQLVICMRDDAIEMRVVGTELWYRMNMQSGIVSPMIEHQVKPMIPVFVFEPHKYYICSSGKLIHTLDFVTTTVYGDTLLGEDTQGCFIPVGTDEMATQGWVEINKDFWDAQFPE